MEILTLLSQIFTAGRVNVIIINILCLQLLYVTRRPYWFTKHFISAEIAQKRTKFLAGWNAFVFVNHHGHRERQLQPAVDGKHRFDTSSFETNSSNKTEQLQKLNVQFAHGHVHGVNIPSWFHKTITRNFSYLYWTDFYRNDFVSKRPVSQSIVLVCYFLYASPREPINRIE